MAAPGPDPGVSRPASEVRLQAWASEGLLGTEAEARVQEPTPHGTQREGSRAADAEAGEGPAEDAAVY